MASKRQRNISMTPTRRRLMQLALASPALLALARPAASLAQDRPAFGLPEDPGNVFISPCGRPFRAKPGQPYPVADWFKAADADADGKLDRAEFIADSLAFFKLLDRNGDGVIGPDEIAFYEQRIAPEVLGMRVDVRGGVAVARPVLETVQGMPGGPESGGMPGGGSDSEGESRLGAPDPEEFSHPRPYDASGAGASPYGFFDEPEPVTAADTHFRGVIAKADFHALAGIHFSTLDPTGLGYLTLAGLPKTPVQRRLERVRNRRR
jgi:hypothetical protein